MGTLAPLSGWQGRASSTSFLPHSARHACSLMGATQPNGSLAGHHEACRLGETKMQNDFALEVDRDEQILAAAERILLKRLVRQGRIS